MSHRHEVTSKHPQGANYRFITACNTKDEYSSFIPSWINHHKKLFPKSEIVIIYVSESIPNNLKEYSNNIILFEPIPSISTAYQAQMIRMLYPILLTDKQNVICDIDMYVMSKDLLTLFDRVPDQTTRYINFGCMSMNMCIRDKQLPLGFSVYSNYVLQNVFKVEDLEDIKKLMLDRYVTENSTYGYEWSTDQHLLYDLFKDYKHLFKIERLGNDRIDRNWFDPNDPNIISSIKKNCIVDFHSPRPYHKYKDFINNVLLNVNYPEST